MTSTAEDINKQIEQWVPYGMTIIKSYLNWGLDDASIISAMYEGLHRALTDYDNTKSKIPSRINFFVRCSVNDYFRRVRCRRTAIGKAKWKRRGLGIEHVNLDWFDPYGQNQKPVHEVIEDDRVKLISTSLADKDLYEYILNNSGLTERERYIIEEYGKGSLFREIAVDLDCTEANVAQIYRRSLTKIKVQLLLSKEVA